VLTAFQTPAVQEQLVAELIANSEERLTASRVRAELARVAARGLYSAPSNTADGVTDLCAPIFDHHDGAVAALTVPFLAQKYVSVTVHAASQALLQTVERISTQLGAGVVRAQKAVEAPPRRAPRKR
jgi:DNA-binding IclR family transcriptional regulator